MGQITGNFVLFDGVVSGLYCITYGLLDTIKKISLTWESQPSIRKKRPHKGLFLLILSSGVLTLKRSL